MVFGVVVVASAGRLLLLLVFFIPAQVHAMLMHPKGDWIGGRRSLKTIRFHGKTV